MKKMPAPKRMASLDSGKDSLEWDRCCDSVSCQARTVRPSSQLNIAARRPASRESTGSSEWGWLRPTSQCRLEGMDQFRRSLRLIGLKPEDVGLSSPQPQILTTSPRGCPDIRAARPKLNTRLQRRTVSADDLRTLLEECPVKDSVKRGVVAKAVYEEWYFKKQDEIRKRKDMERDFETSKHCDMEAHKREQFLKNKAKFDEWVKQKDAKKKEELSKPLSKKGGLGKRSMSNPDQAEAAFITWKQAKEKQLKKQKEDSLKDVDEEQERQAKRADAEKAFQHWKEKKDEEIQKVLKEKERLDRLIKEDEEKLKHQKIKESEISFKVWKLKKDRELQEKINKAKAAEKKKEDAVKSIEERRYEANQAFLGWLDTVEQREREQQLSQSNKETPRSSRRQSPVRTAGSTASSRASSPGPWKPDRAYGQTRNKPSRTKGN